MPRYQNRMNDLSTTEWLKFQKSWFVHSPPRRKPGLLQHPAKFPETLAEEFIEFFTCRGGWVFDPMAGTGSALVAALRSGRNSLGIELNPDYAEIARQALQVERQELGETAANLRAEIFTSDAADLASLDFPLVDYVITSPPYWDMLHARGFETQKRRRTAPNLDVVYSADPRDLGNIGDYDEFIGRLVQVYAGLRSVMRPRAYLTIIVKNVKKGGKVYPLAWDLARELGKVYELKDEKIWCQNDVPLAPYGMGNAWVSNTVHHYCLQFRNENQ